MDAVSTTFSRVKKSQRGYDVDEVETFLEEVKQAFQQPGTGEVDAEAIRTVGFRLSKGGYDVDQVDRALDRLEDEFAKRAKEQLLARGGKEALFAGVRGAAKELLARLKRARGAKFRRAGWLRQGYDRRQVDDFAERLVAYFESREKLTVAEVRSATFRPKSNGYSEAQVDAVLDAVVEIMLAVR